MRDDATARYTSSVRVRKRACSRQNVGLETVCRTILALAKKFPEAARQGGFVTSCAPSRCFEFLVRALDELHDRASARLTGRNALQGLDKIGGQKDVDRAIAFGRLALHMAARIDPMAFSSVRHIVLPILTN